MLVFLAFSCASAEPLREQDRTLLVDPESPSLIYPYIGETCKHPERRFLRGCSPVRVILKYDFNQKADRDKLINMGFTCQSTARFKY